LLGNFSELVAIVLDGRVRPDIQLIVPVFKHLEELSKSTSQF
jgi:hypothetical protein